MRLGSEFPDFFKTVRRLPKAFLNGSSDKVNIFTLKTTSWLRMVFKTGIEAFTCKDPLRAAWRSVLYPSVAAVSSNWIKMIFPALLQLETAGNALESWQYIVLSKQAGRCKSLKKFGPHLNRVYLSLWWATTSILLHQLSPWPSLFLQISSVS